MGEPQRENTVVGTLWTPPKFRYRAYSVEYVPRPPHFVCTNVFSRLLHELPLSFKWRPYRDRDGLCAYIDCLCQGRQTEANYYVDQGAVTDLELAPAPPAEETVVLRVEELLDVLALRQEWRVPLALRIRFVGEEDGKAIAASDFTTNLLQHTQVPGWSRRKSLRKVRLLTEKEIRGGMQLRFGDLHTGVNLDRPEWVQREGDGAPLVDPAPWVTAEDTEAAEDEAPRETEVRRRVEPTWLDVLTRVDHQGSTWFVRRILSNEGAVLYEATAHTAAGPWKAWRRDNAALLARKITP